MFKLQIETVNAAFHNGEGRDEVIKILHEVSNRIDNGINCGCIKDINGNTVGQWGIES